MPISDRTYSTLKRIQILTGALPVGLFLLLHLYTNGHAIQGATAFNRYVQRLWKLPFVPALELAGIAAPLAAHVALGILVGRTAQAAEDARGFPAHWMMVAQRVTGFVLVVYVVFHVWSTRLSPARLGGETDLFGLMSRQLAAPGWLAFHILGVIAAAHHFGNGLAAVAGPWGLDLGPAARRRAARTGVAAFVLLSLFGVNALLAFVHPAWRWLEPSGLR